MGRAPCCDKSKVKKGPWSIEEDELLKKFIAKFGNGGNWISLPKKAGLNRCGKSCRLRWLNYLRPNIKHGDFTEEEDHIIYTLYNTIGSRWSVIASKLAGRTDNDVKNYWNTKLKKKIMEGKFEKVSSSFPTIKNSENSNYSNKNYSYWQNLGTEKFGSGSDQKQLFQYHHPGQGASNSVTQEISSYSSSYMDSDQNSSSSNSIIMTNKADEYDFWMDLLSESFDKVVVGSQLDEKISEMASLLYD